MRKECDNWYNRIVRDSRYNDRRQKRVIDPRIPFINSVTLFKMQNDQQNKCYYCLTEMEWLERRSNKKGLTVERADNRLPHYISNCLGLACKSCNSKQYTHEKGLIKRYFSKWKDFALNVHVTFDCDDTRCPSYIT